MQPLIETPCKYGITNATDKQVVFSIDDYREALQPLTDRAWKGRCAYKNKKGETGWTDGPLTGARVSEHLTGYMGCGVGFIAPGESTTRLALFDLDAHNGETSFSEMMATANRLCARLEAIGLPPTVFRSSGGSGIHIWILWDSHQDAHSVRHALQGVLIAEGLTPGAGGVADKQVEIFPKQADIEPGRCGNMAILPLWNKSELLIDELGLRLELTPAGKGAVIGMTWPMSEPVPYVVNPAPERVPGELATPDPLDKIKRAMAAVGPLAAELSTTSCATNYDTWLKMLFSTHEASAGEEDGFVLFKEWEDKNPANAGRRNARVEWDRCQADREGKRVTRGTLYAMASKCDPEWDAPTPDGFDDGPMGNTSRGAPPADDTTTSDVANAAALIDMTDSGNVNAMAEITDGNLRFVHGADVWMFWRDNRWTIDLAAIHANLATQKVAEMYRSRARQKLIEADAATSPADKKLLLKLEDSCKSWANYCRNRRGIDALLTLATRDQRFVIYQDALDGNRYLLGVDNGVVDLRTGELRQSARDDAITKRSPYTYQRDAMAPRFLQFIAEITSQPIDDGCAAGLMQYRQRPDLAAYLQRALGYMLTGSVVEQKMFIGSGPGANGKSILFDVIEKIMGPYCVRMPPEALMASARDGDAERPTPFARSVAGARLVVTSEAKEGQKLNVALVKRQTGDARLTARGMRENAYTFDVTHKLVLLTNHHPELDQADDAIRGRLHIIPFERTWNRPGVPIRNPRLTDGDKHLMLTLEGEAEGILAWLVRGAVAYGREGLEPPPDVADVTSTYLHEQDAFGRWLEDMEHCDIRAGSGASALLELFQAWCVRHGVAHPTPNNATAFGKGLSVRNTRKGRTVAGIVYGLRPRVGDLF